MIETVPQTEGSEKSKNSHGSSRGQWTVQSRGGAWPHFAGFSLQREEWSWSKGQSGVAECAEAYPWEPWKSRA